MALTVVQQLLVLQKENAELRAAAGATLPGSGSDSGLRAENAQLKAELAAGGPAGLIAKLANPACRPDDAECVQLWKHYAAADAWGQQVIHKCIVNWQTWTVRGMRIEKETTGKGN